MDNLDDWAIEEGGISVDRMFELDRDGKYLLVFDNPLTDSERASIAHQLEDWLKSSDRPFAIISGAKIVFARKHE